jgi:hypothetical protein
LTERRISFTSARRISRAPPRRRSSDWADPLLAGPWETFRADSDSPQERYAARMRLSTKTPSPHRDAKELIARGARKC